MSRNRVRGSCVFWCGLLGDGTRLPSLSCESRSGVGRTQGVVSAIGDDVIGEKGEETQVLGAGLVQMGAKWCVFVTSMQLKRRRMLLPGRGECKLPVI